MTDFIIRPRIQLAMWNEEEALFEPIGSFAFEEFWAVPAVGDVLPAGLAHGAIEVVGRHYTAGKEEHERWWWLVVVDVTDPRQKAMEDLDTWVRQEHAEIQAERLAQAMAEFEASMRRKKGRSGRRKS